MSLHRMIPRKSCVCISDH